LPQGLGQGQGAVGLKVAEFGFTGRRQLGIKPLASCLGRGCLLGKGPLHRRAQLGFEGVGDAQHGQGDSGSALDHPAAADPAGGLRRRR
jgi:hypothetical protein